MVQQKITGSRFVGGAHPAGFGINLLYDSETRCVSGMFQIDETKQGPPGHVHGGALATLLDEAMGAVAWYSGYRVLVVNLNLNYKRAVPLNTPIRLEASIDRIEGRKIYTQGKLFLPDDALAVEGTGIFVDAPHVVGEQHPNPFDWE